MTARERFQDAVRRVVARGDYPGPLAVLRELRPETTRHMLNSREIAWRAEVLLALGWRRHPWCAERDAFNASDRAYKMVPNGTGGWRHNELTCRFRALPVPRYRWLRP